MPEWSLSIEIGARCPPLAETLLTVCAASAWVSVDRGAYHMADESGADKTLYQHGRFSLIETLAMRPEIEVWLVLMTISHEILM